MRPPQWGPVSTGKCGLAGRRLVVRWHGERARRMPYSFSSRAASIFVLTSSFR
jgi:hypothetical protein